MTPKKKRHELAAIALIYARCECGWFYRAEKLRGKSDEDLAVETGFAFTEHQDAMQSER